MPFMLYRDVRFWVLAGCPVCRKLMGYREGDQDLKSLFSEDCKIKNILLKHNFDLSNPRYGVGRVWFDRLERGYALRNSLVARRAHPDLQIDIETNRLAKVAEEYTIEYVSDVVFINRVSVINVSHPANESLIYRYQLRVVPCVMSPFAPHGILRGLSAEEPEREIERLYSTVIQRYAPRKTSPA